MNEQVCVRHVAVNRWALCVGQWLLRVCWAMAAEHECSESELRSELEQSTITARIKGLFYSCVVTSASYI